MVRTNILITLYTEYLKLQQNMKTKEAIIDGAISFLLIWIILQYFRNHGTVMT